MISDIKPFWLDMAHRRHVDKQARKPCDREFRCATKESIAQGRENLEI